MIYTINNCIRAFGYTNFDKLIADMGSVDNLKAYVIANGYADIAAAEDTELLLVDVNGKTWHTGCYGAKLEPEVEQDYLCFTSKSLATVKTIGAKKTIAGTTYMQHLFFDYKINDGEWQRLKPGSISGESEQITLNYNDKLYVKADDWGPNPDVPDQVYTRIYIGGNVECSGNIMSLCGFKKELTHEYQFYNLFYNSGFETAPKLPATTLTPHCYDSMFKYCYLLKQAPELPATTLAQFCYADMFKGCTSLINAPELPALELADNCYWGMFGGCSNLNHVKALFLDSYNTGNMANWLSGVSPTGTFVKNPDATWQYAQPNIPSGWTIKTTNELEQGSLCFTSTGDSTISMTQEGTQDKSAGKVIQYKLNDGQWQIWDLSVVSLHDGDKMYLKSDDYIQISEKYDIYKSFVMTGSIAASGNIMSLLNFSGILTDYAFYSLYKNCTSLTQAPALPATTLTNNCYGNMFNGCTSLTTTPELPATILSDVCYSSMFSGCTSLVNAPELPATNLTFGCYQQMFQGCTSLVNAPALPATIVISNCYDSMFSGCTSLTTAPELPATTLQSSCYYFMFSGCTSLTQAPELPVTSISYACYAGMFQGCTALTAAPALPATTLEGSCYSSMFSGCTSLVNAPALPATTLSDWCYDSMFSGCTSLTQAPELPATTLADYCYNNMFNGCTNLNYVKAMFTTDLTGSSYLNMWLDYVSETGTFVKNSAATWDNTAAEIPSGWTVQTASPDK